MTRDLIIVDTETTGVDSWHTPIEIAAINDRTGATIEFTPHLSREEIACADPAALRINRYFERGLAENRATPADTLTHYRDLFDMLTGNTLAGVNPRFDVTMLMRGWRRAITHLGAQSIDEPDIDEPWHHRLADLSAYAAAHFQLPPTRLPDLSQIARMCDITNPAPHTALGDAQTTRACFATITTGQTADTINLGGVA